MKEATVQVGCFAYGIPNMKLEKGIIDRRIRLMEEAGVRFECGWMWEGTSPERSCSKI